MAKHETEVEQDVERQGDRHHQHDWQRSTDSLVHLLQHVIGVGTGDAETERIQIALRENCHSRIHTN